MIRKLKPITLRTQRYIKRRRLKLYIELLSALNEWFNFQDRNNNNNKNHKNSHFEFPWCVCVCTMSISMWNIFEFHCFDCIQWYRYTFKLHLITVMPIGQVDVQLLKCIIFFVIVFIWKCAGVVWVDRVNWIYYFKHIAPKCNRLNFTNWMMTSYLNI